MWALKKTLFLVDFSPSYVTLTPHLQRAEQVFAQAILGDLIERGQKHNVAAPLLRAAFASLSIYQSGLERTKAVST